MSIFRHLSIPSGPPFTMRTDLACESTASSVACEEEHYPIGQTPVTVLRRQESDSARSVTISCGRITERGEDELPTLAHLLSDELQHMASTLLGRAITPECRIFVVGLGNADMTPDAIGPGTVRRLTVTRHLRDYDAALFDALGCCELAALAPGVMGQTGFESGELVGNVAQLLSPDLVIAVDALAARSCERLASTIQLSDRGIAPGAGIGNHRMAIDHETMGCPVIGLGVPTVVDSSTLVLDAWERAGMTFESVPEALMTVLESGRSFIVSPRDSDRMVELTCMLLARALDIAFGVAPI